jgi:hypothetical protein
MLTPVRCKTRWSFAAPVRKPAADRLALRVERLSHRKPSDHCNMTRRDGTMAWRGQIEAQHKQVFPGPRLHHDLVSAPTSGHRFIGFDASIRRGGAAGPSVHQQRSPAVQPAMERTPVPALEYLPVWQLQHGSQSPKEGDRHTTTRSFDAVRHCAPFAACSDSSQCSRRAVPASR